MNIINDIRRHFHKFLQGLIISLIYAKVGSVYYILQNSRILVILIFQENRIGEQFVTFRVQDYTLRSLR